MSYHNARLKRSILLFFPAILQSHYGILHRIPSAGFPDGSVLLYFSQVLLPVRSESWRRVLSFPLRQRLPEDLSDQCLYVGNSCFHIGTESLSRLLSSNPGTQKIRFPAYPSAQFYLLHRQRKPDRFPAYSRVRLRHFRFRSM